jgi:hypothetical protein
MQKQLRGAFILTLALGLASCSSGPSGVSAGSSATATASASPTASESPEDRPKMRRSSRRAHSKGFKAPATAADKTVSLKECGLQFTLPEGWGMVRDNDGTVVGPMDESMAMLIVEMEGVEAKDIWPGVDEILASIVTDVKKPDKRTESKTAGYKTTTLQGSGKLEGEPALWAVDIIESPNPLMVISFGEEAKVTAHMKEAEQLGNSFKKLEK